MSREEARGHIRAAQEAELAGNKDGAVRHLERAALFYVRARQMGRAAQMYQHALRLLPGRKDLAEALEKAEAWAAEHADSEPAPAMEISADLANALSEATASLEAPAVLELNHDAFARGPTKAPDDLDAWCSFCCRPRKETGPLAQGPAGAFICASCISLSAGLVGSAVTVPVAPVPAAAPQDAPPSMMGGASRAWSAEGPAWIGPELLLNLARAALRGDGRSMVVVGEAGTGKSTFLAALAAEFSAAVRVDLAQGEPLSAGMEPLLIDHIEAGAAGWGALNGRPFVAALRSAYEPRPLAVRQGEAVLNLPVASVALPPGFPTVATFALPAMNSDAMFVLLESRLESTPGLELGDALKAALVTRALELGRGAHGLIGDLAALSGLPKGGMLELEGKVKRARKRKKS